MTSFCADATSMTLYPRTLIGETDTCNRRVRGCPTPRPAESSPRSEKEKQGLVHDANLQARSDPINQSITANSTSHERIPSLLPVSTHGSTSAYRYDFCRREQCRVFARPWKREKGCTVRQMPGGMSMYTLVEIIHKNVQRNQRSRTSNCFK